MHILLAWIGHRDLAAAGLREKGVEDPRGPRDGPIALAAMGGTYARIELLSDHEADLSRDYVAWLKTITQSDVGLHPVDLGGNAWDWEMLVMSASAVLERVRSLHPGARIVFHLSPGTSAMTATWVLLSKRHPGIRLVQVSADRSAMDEVQIPLDIDFTAHHREDATSDLERLLQGLPPTAPQFDEIKRQSTVMEKRVAEARRYAATSDPVLILGDSGTGKELFARAIHQASPRCGRELIAVNCAAIPPQLVESELFGHRRGSFTGADRDHHGFIEQANGSTLFLDEIGDMPPGTQVKLLRCLNNGTFRRIGDTTERSSDFRIVAATNRNLLEEIGEGRKPEGCETFRSDLFYRIAVGILQIPALRERMEDLDVLVDCILEEIARRRGHAVALTTAAKARLRAHAWPGNVRELQNTISRAALRSADEQITRDDVEAALLPIHSQETVLGRPLGAGLDIKDVLSQVASHYLERALSEAGGNKTRASALVGLSSYQTFDNWMKRYGISQIDRRQ